MHTLTSNILVVNSLIHNITKYRITLIDIHERVRAKKGHNCERKREEKGNIFEDIGVDNKLCDGNDKML